MKPLPNGKMALNLAIVGGGRACQFFLELVQLGNLPFLDIHILGVCDIDPKAEGMQTAKRLGIYTTSDFRDLFILPNLDGIIEMTNSQEVLVELIRHRPPRIGIIEHNIGRLLRDLFSVYQKLRSAEQQIVFEKAVRDFLIQQSKQCIVVINADFTIAAVNDAYLKSAAQQREDVVGGYCYRILRGLDAPCDALRDGIFCPMLETVRTGDSTEGIHSLAVGGQAAPRYRDIVTYPVKNAQGETIRVIEIWMDISRDTASRWEKRERELKSDLNKLIQEDRLISLGKLVASCVHEINNPIQGLLTFSHLMKQMLAGDHVDTTEITQLREFAGIMADELERCGKIISGLLSFSRQSQSVFQPVDLNGVVTTVTDLIRHQIELKDLRFQLDLCTDALVIHGDKARLQQCFLNLVFNAIETMGPGGRLSVTSTMDQEKQAAQIQIRDTGHGIPQRHLGHIYDPFFTTKAMGEGTGMGLSIVYGVVKHHRGEITVDSHIDQGTTFTIRFPLSASSGATGS